MVAVDDEVASQQQQQQQQQQRNNNSSKSGNSSDAVSPILRAWSVVRRACLSMPSTGKLTKTSVAPAPLLYCLIVHEKTKHQSVRTIAKPGLGNKTVTFADAVAIVTDAYGAGGRGGRLEEDGGITPLGRGATWICPGKAGTRSGRAGQL